MTPAALVKRLRSELAANVDPVYREGARRFFREPIELWGVRAPIVRRIAREAFKDVKVWTQDEREEFAGILWRSKRAEEAGIAILTFQRFNRTAGKHEFDLFERWVDCWVTNWSACDGVSSWLLAGAIANEPSLISRLPEWTRSSNRWKRRAAIVALLQEAKQGRHTDAIFEVAARLIEDVDDMVQKGVGWVLKETYPKRPRELMRFLKPLASRTPRLVLRIAAEKMSAADRAELLARR